MADKKFDQKEYIKEWKKQNMKMVRASFKNDFVEDFKKACAVLGIKQSDAFREAMQKTIDRAAKVKKNG